MGSPRREPPPPEHSLHPRLYEGMEEAARRGDWEAWLHDALETGDPKFWPHIRQFYRERPDWRWMIVFHLRIYWREYEHMVAPLFREALRDPEQCDEAIRAVEEFPGLKEDVLACLQDRACLRTIFDSLPQAIACLKTRPELAVPLLRDTLRDPVRSSDPKCAYVALQAASVFPQLAEDVVECLHDREFVEYASPDAIVATLACQFGLTEDPGRNAHFAWRGPDPVLDGVRAELKGRYSLDLDRLVSES